MISFYIHIPFCKRKCAYCDFLSSADTSPLPAYTDMLLKEISAFKTDEKIHSIFIGGGTPSFIPDAYITKILSLIKNSYDLEENCEISIETNPGTLDESKLYAYKATGINRLSIGVQSFDDRLLKTLGRIHDSKTAQENISLAKKYFDNINLDLMFALPYQSMEDWKKTLRTAVSFCPTHISAYSLIIEEGTPFYDKYDYIDENLDRTMYYYAKDFLRQNGFYQYEISNFAKQGYSCKHNLVYWQGGDYKGFGLGAASLTDNKRLKNTEDMGEYLNGVSVSEVIPLDKAETMKEFVMLGLRCTDGINADTFKSRFGLDLFDTFGDILLKHQKNGLLDIDQKTVKLTAKGTDLSNIVFIDLV
ncbi:MAG: oxygen-independent coproporphyrinogen III oxidase [Firmicutes bacterium]|nr:oxygen-independent coproporphyrinogen III oxidase [Bacillota bacterium]